MQMECGFIRVSLRNFAAKLNHTITWQNKLKENVPFARELKVK